ncbi:MAG: LacI family DNA-binding transcriptional regulator [Anaerolineae bacterium]|nr:LacI family DNA-binding transcriptional regulator [Anaerolineae bacterium]
MATIEDVAKRAGVAPITVSRVINNSGYCSEKTLERSKQQLLNWVMCQTHWRVGCDLKKQKRLAWLLQILLIRSLQSWRVV